MKLAHYSKGACANVGANRVAERLKQLEHDAASSAFDKCLEGLEVLLQELDQLWHEAKAR
jgi:HPt (histidine-containing phosphotransfer) domain-containing protein